jgi:hypothetical protein
VKAIQDNPNSGALGTISAFLIGMIPQVDPAIQSIVIFWLQVFAFTVSITVGIFTIIGYWRNFKTENKGDNK